MKQGRICHYCGSEFNDPDKDYCSKKCLSLACGFSYHKKICNTCGKDFETLTDASYCSFEWTTLQRNEKKRNNDTDSTYGGGELFGTSTPSTYEKIWLSAVISLVAIVPVKK